MLIRSLDFDKEDLAALSEAEEIFSAIRALIETFNQSPHSWLNSLGFKFPLITGFEGLNSKGEWVGFSFEDIESFSDRSKPELRELKYPEPLIYRKGNRAGTLSRLGAEFNWTCVYCHGKGTTELGPDHRVWHMDHGYPRIFGGDDDPDNLFLACATCNIRKNKKTIREMMGPKFLETSANAEG